MERIFKEETRKDRNGTSELEIAASPSKGLDEKTGDCSTLQESITKKKGGEGTATRKELVLRGS